MASQLIRDFFHKVKFPRKETSLLFLPRRIVDSEIYVGKPAGGNKRLFLSPVHFLMCQQREKNAIAIGALQKLERVGVGRLEITTRQKHGGGRD